MRLWARFLLVFAASSLLQRAFVTTADCADCFLTCMQMSGCWSGRSLDPTALCDNQPNLCRIQCEGKANSGWGAIAYSSKEKIAGWSFEQGAKASAESVAMTFCNKQGGRNCVVEASFFNSCGAVAADGDKVSWGTASSRAAAEQRAMAECGKSGGRACKVEAWVCSAPNGSSASPGTPPPPRAVSWGAIAYSARDMSEGHSMGKSDKATAEREAMSLCAQRGKSCVLETSFNKQCGALAADCDFTGVGVSADQREAMQKSLDECRKAGGTRCVPHVLFCSM